MEVPADPINLILRTIAVGVATEAVASGPASASG